MKARAILFALAILVACASADVLILDPTPRPARIADSVIVLLEEPAQPYQTIALIEVGDQGWGLSLESLAKKLRKEAAKLGGHAVMIGTPSTESGGTVIVPIGNTFYGAPIDEKKLVGKVIVFTTPQRQ